MRNTLLELGSTLLLQLGMTTYRKTWDKDEFAKKARDRLVAENGENMNIVLLTVNGSWAMDVNLNKRHVYESRDHV
jgi:hypothetical protein